MKRSTAFTLLIILLFTGCSGTKTEKTLAPDEQEDLYETAITSTRSAETNEAFPVIDDADDADAQSIFDLLGISPADMSAYALSVSRMNASAYAIAAVYPAAGKEDTVLDSLHAFVDDRVQSFKQSPADQYEIAVNARLETLEDGTVLLVMCENQDAVFDAIQDVIEGG